MPIKLRFKLIAILIVLVVVATYFAAQTRNPQQLAGFPRFDREMLLEINIGNLGEREHRGSERRRMAGYRPDEGAALAAGRSRPDQRRTAGALLLAISEKRRVVRTPGH